MKEIKYQGETAAIFHKNHEWKNGLDFLTPESSFIQTGTWLYQAGIELKAHKHLYNERIVEKTQETVIVLTGKMRIDLYDDEKNIFHQEELCEGDLAILLSKGHGYCILENNTRIVEVKNGPFFSLEKDKELL
jgi:hypothetical protein